MTDHQEQVDEMLALGRSMIGEHYTNPLKDTLSQKLTDFTQKWSNLELAWQNWYDELHSTGEQSQDLSDLYDGLNQTLSQMEPVVKEILPASVTAETLESDLKQLQEKFDKEVVAPLSVEKPRFESLSLNSHLLPNCEEVEQTLKAYKSLLSSAETQNAELLGLVHSVSSWWPEFVATTKKLDGVEEQLSEDRPLAGSVPVVEKQDKIAQSLLLSIEELKPKVMRCLKRLVGVAGHSNVVKAASITAGKDKLQHSWEGQYKQVEERRDHVELGRVRVKVYAECRDPFEQWLGEAEKKLGQWRWMEKGMGEQIEKLKAFKLDVELHSHDMQSCEALGNRFLSTAKAHQDLLLAYRKKISPGDFSSCLMPDNFYNLEMEGLRSPNLSSTKAEDGPALHSQVYRNGLQVVSEDLLALKRRFDKLKGCVERQAKRFEEAREIRVQFYEALDAFTPKIESAEKLLEGFVMESIGRSSKHTLKQQLDMMKKLETEYLELHPLLWEVVSSANELVGSELVDSEDKGEEKVGEDEVFIEKAAAEQRYQTLEEELRKLREEVDATTAKAQAFKSLCAAFAGWLRNTERKIQQDHSLKLESNGLKSRLTYLQSVAADISAHEDPYTELCGQFQTAMAVAGKGAEASDLNVKLENLEMRWSSLQGT